ncbi:MAG: PQQ-like beta-propeller repeat protein, partial [Methanothrix sp.]|nr:PQQ-like beta-propeller repeat protein [Methanothrix sp.]
ATTTFGPYTGDTTGGTFFNFVPDKIGNYQFQFFYGGQITTGNNITNRGFGGLYQMPSTSLPYTLVVQQDPIVQTSYPITSLPTSWWQTPVSAENVQEWSKITGDWLGLGSITFASTGSYNATTRYNPYTASVLSGHILWTKQWLAGGVAGGESVGTSGGTEDSGHYWSTRQYQPQYAPVIINGKMYSTWYPETMGYSNGILCTDLFTGETLFRINTTNSLRCGMVVKYHHINQYGAIGPFIWTTGTLPVEDTGGRQIGNNPSSYMNTTGTQWNMYSAFTGQYVLSIVNGTGLTLREDENGNLIGYYINNTAGKERTFSSTGVAGTATSTGPHVSCFNMTRAIGQTGGSWQPSLNTVRDWQTGVMWTVPLPNATDDGTPISSPLVNPNLSLSLNSITGNELMFSAGFIHMQGGGDEVPGWLVYAALDMNDGHKLYCKNYTYAAGATEYLPFTRTSRAFGDGMWATVSLVSFDMNAYDSRTGNKIWSTKLKTPYGDGTTNVYNNFGISSQYVGNNLLWYGLGGDIWCQDARTGKQLWYTNTTTLIGDPGIETPYDVWPLWVFSSPGYTTDVAYLTIGHEYNPPLFHGSQMLAVNMTDGSLVWSELGMYIRSTAIANNIMLSMNAYDNQIYAFGKGPSTMTVSAPSIGVTTATPITITGTVMDISPGTRAITQPDITLTKQNEIALNFPNGIPCVSDASQSRWMEHVYQQQPALANTTGVQITLSAIDANNNFRQIGTTTSTASGTFAFNWTPDIPGAFTVIASFAGSNSYYPSSAETHFYANMPAATNAPTATAQANVATTTDVAMYLIAGVIAIIVAIAIVGLLILRKH